jgi:hypothetical protein
MGLAERRAMEEVKGEQFENYKKGMEEIVGKEIELEVDWDSFMEYNTKDISNNIDKRGFQVLLDGMQRVCQDDMGKSAVQDGVKKIVFRGVKGSGSKATLTFEDGVLTMISGIDGNGLWSGDRIQKTLEGGL